MRYQAGQTLDHFDILEPLGEGAYAESYKARDRNTGAVVVLKSPNPTIFADPAIFARFKREGEIAKRLHHPGVAGGLDTGEHRTEPYLVLEFVDGENFRRRLREYEGALPVDVALQYGRELADAIAYLNANGIVHRDLKPENIIVTPDNHLKIIDFGTALLDGAKRLTWRHLSESLGTPDYMSPEQIQGERGDIRSDIYAWGAMMYEFLTGRVPFTGDNWMAVMAGHLTKDPERIRKYNSQVSPALEAVVLKAMRRDPEHRYQTPEALLDDLAHLDTLDVAKFDLSPEPPMGGMAAMESTKRLWQLIAIVSVSFIALAAAVILIARFA
jgi:serine/threonine-protein kinase